MSVKRETLPLISVIVAYGSFLIGVGVLRIVATPEYQHRYDLDLSLVGLGWSILALISLSVSATTLLLAWEQQPGWLRLATVALNLFLVVGLAVVFDLTLTSLQKYNAGFVAYDTAVQVCGQPPVLASRGLEAQGTYILPNNADYDRLKYSTQDDLLLGVPKFFCSAADAEAHGYRSEINP
jgi:hypothetical protein